MEAESKAEVHCPYCGSDNVYKDKFSAKGFVIGVLLIGIPFIFPSKKYHCFECGKDFKRGRKE